MRVFLTGASGAVGSHVARALVERGADVLALVREPQRAARLSGLKEAIDILPGRLGQSVAWKERLKAFQPDVAIHLAWEGVGGTFRFDSVQLSNLSMALDLLEALRESACGAFVGMGSQAEYGIMAGAVDEEQPLRPTTLYGTVKVTTGMLAERLCAMNEMRFAWLRLFSTYGPGDDPNWLIPYVIRTLLRGERPALTTGEQLWDYLYVADAADAVVTVASESEAEGFFNLGSGQARQVREIVEEIRDQIDPRLPLGFGEIPLRAEQVMRLQARIDRLERVAGWQPVTSWQEGIAEAIAWWREQLLGESRSAAVTP